MFEWGDRKRRRAPLYNGSAAFRLCGLSRGFLQAVTLLGAFAVAGCSSYQLELLTAKNDPDGDVTGSVSRPSGAAAKQAPLVPPSEVDLAYARAAAADALTRGVKENSVPWQNPHTGVGGNITPLAAARNQGGVPCRDFLASYVRGGSQAWLAGAACRTSRGEWEVKSLKPLSG